MCTESYGHCLALSFTSRLNVVIYVCYSMPYIGICSFTALAKYITKDMF